MDKKVNGKVSSHGSKENSQQEKRNALKMLGIGAISTTLITSEYSTAQVGEGNSESTIDTISVQNYEQLKTLPAASMALGTVASVFSEGIAGDFLLADGGAIDNGGTIFSATENKHWKRVFSGGADVNWFYDSSDSDHNNAIQRAINSHNKVIISSGKSYFLSSSGNNITINKSDFELVIEGGAQIIKSGGGAIFHIGSESGSYTNIKIHGKGKIVSESNIHETTGFLLGSENVSIDNLSIESLSIFTNKYGIVSGDLELTLTNLKVYNNHIKVDLVAGATIGQAMDVNLPSANIRASGIITGNTFYLTNNSNPKGDAFKWTNGSIIFSDNQCIVEGQGQTVAVFSSMEDSVISDSKFEIINSTGSIEDAIQINNSTDSEFSNLHAIVGSSAGGGVQIGNNLRCNIQVNTNHAIRQTGNTYMTDCVLSNFSASQLHMASGGSSWTRGKIVGGMLQGQAFITANKAIVKNVRAELNGALVRGLYIRGSENQIDGFTIKDSQSSYAIQIEGSNNELKSITLDQCKAAWQVISGNNNRIGKISFPSPSSAFYGNYSDSGFNTGYPLLTLAGLSGTTTLSIPSNPDGHTIIEIAQLSSDTVISNIVGANDKDRVTFYIMSSAHSFTFNNTNAKLSANLDFIGSRYDSLSLLYDEASGLWIETSRSINS